jgi:sterol desaturase/sphingolipid hydroxylase (fatty acid hydroxylase superfamily)
MDQRGALSSRQSWRWAAAWWMSRRLLCGISPDIFVVVGPFNIITSCLVHANLNWTFGPLRYVLVSPVFHRWHHARRSATRISPAPFALGM